MLEHILNKRNKELSAEDLIDITDTVIYDKNLRLEDFIQFVKKHGDGIVRDNLAVMINAKKIGDICPVCWSDKIEHDFVEINGDNLYRPWKCLNCGNSGYEYYFLQNKGASERFVGCLKKQQGRSND